MRRRRETASCWALLRHCGYWATPEAEWVDDRGDEADMGDRFHRATATYLAGAEPGGLADDVAQKYAHAKAWIDSLGVPRSRLGRELAFAWDPETDTAESLGCDLGRDYSKAAPGRFCGTADLVMLVMGDLDKTTKPVAAMVWDWGTGDVAGKGPQLRALGLMVARAYDVEQVTVAALEVRDTGIREVIREDLDSFALAAVAGELAEALASVSDDAQPKPGPHCADYFCNARLTCPSLQTAMGEVVDIIPAESLVRRPGWRITDPVRTAEQAIWALSLVRNVEKWTAAKKSELKDKVPPEGWTTEDGTTIRDSTRLMPRFSQAMALALCRQLGATEAQIAALTVEVREPAGLKVSGGNTKPRTRRGKAA